MQIVDLQLLSPTTLITFSTELWLYQQYQQEQYLPFHQNMLTKRLHHIILLFLFIDTKNWYLTNWDGTVTSRGPITQQILEKLHCLLSKIMNNKQVLIYGVLESTIDLRSIFVGHINFKKLEFRKLIEMFHCCMTRLRKSNLDVFIQCQYTRNIQNST